MSHRLLAGGAVITLALSGCAEKVTMTAVQPTSSASGSATAAIDQAVQKAGALNTVNLRFITDGTMAQGQHGHVDGWGKTQLRPTVAAALQMNVAVGSQAMPLQMILLGDNLYLKGPMSPQIANGKPWVKLSAQQMSSMSGLNVNSILEQLQLSGPGNQAKIFATSKDIKQVGPENVDGAPVTHYTGTVNVQDALGKFSGHARTSLQQMFQRLGVSTIAMELWVDGQSMPRKVVSTMKTSNGPITNVLLYWGYNQSFNIQAPPSSQVGQYTGQTPAPGASG